MKKWGGGGKLCVYVHKDIYTRGIWGHAPQENLVFRLSETASGGIWGHALPGKFGF